MLENPCGFCRKQRRWECSEIKRELITEGKGVGMTQPAMSSKASQRFLWSVWDECFCFQKCFIKAALFLHKRMESLFIYLALPEASAQTSRGWKEHLWHAQLTLSSLRFGAFSLSPHPPWAGLHWSGEQLQVPIWRIKREGKKAGGTPRKIFKTVIAKFCINKCQRGQLLIKWWEPKTK